VRVKNWEHYQHYRGRRPPWIKLYRDLLDDHEWHLLDPFSAKTLISLWLLASENDGELPDVPTLAFRLRVAEQRVISALANLDHWLEHDASNMLAPCKHDASTMLAACKQHATPETETETEKEKETEHSSSAPPMDVSAFDRFWAAYPRKVGKGAARSAWKSGKLTGKLDAILAAVEKQKASEQWRKDGGQFIPHPATWLRQERWEDEGLSPPTARATVPAESARARHDRALREIDMAIRQAEASAVAPDDVDRAVDGLRDKYRDQPAALREALEVWNFRQHLSTNPQTAEAQTADAQNGNGRPT
jgi:hypothetical protein